MEGIPKLFIFIQYLINFQTPWCSTKENLDCVSSIKVNTSDCLQQCSGILVTSLNEDRLSNMMSKMVEMLSINSKSFDFAKELEGFCVQNIS